MFDTFRRSWELAKASLAVLRSDKELLIFPLISFLALAVVTISLASLYRYATKGDPGSNFRAETMSAAFRSKSGGAPSYGGPR